MDLSQFSDIEPHDFSASYTTVSQELFPSLDFDISRRPFSLELQQQQRELASEDKLPPEMVSHGPISLETVPDATYSGPNLTQLAESPWSSSMPMDLSALTTNLLSEQYAADAMDAELFQQVQPIRSSVISVGLSAPTINPQSEQHAFNAMLPQDSRILQDSFHRSRSGLQRTAPKRRQKAATMSDQRWKPASDRIRHLYVVEGKLMKDVREKINAEFGFDATERQYKARISNMKLERKCTIQQRKTILRHVQYRKERLGKGSMHVCVRGHMLTQEKIARWSKEPALTKALSNIRPPSPLPTEISIRTAVHLNSPRSRGETLSCIRFLDETENSPALRILDNAQQGNQVMDPQHARGLFNDIQQLLETRDNPPRKMKGFGWRPSLEQYLVHIRNMMNLGSKLLVSGVSSSLTPINSEERCQNNSRRLAKRDLKFAAWQTQYGRMELSFWSASTDVDDENRARKTKCLTSPDLARITLFTRSRTKSIVCVNLDFNPLWNLPMKLTYQVMVPNDSEVFKIIDAGDVEALKNALAMKTASLTDRDENGRSLLSYAATSARVDMCRFLLAHGADMNVMEPNNIGFMSPVHHHHRGNDEEVEEELLKNKSQCYQIMLESGADLSLETYIGDNSWMLSYEHSLFANCYATFRQILLLGQPFVNANTKVSPDYGSTCFTSYPLLRLADHCREPSTFALDILEKAILLLRLTADITVVNEECNNVLHCTLKARVFEDIEGKEAQAKAWMVAACDCDRCNASFREPRQLLTAAIAAGADIYAFNQNGDTPTMVAERCDREAEWVEALEECGIDVEKVFLHTKEWENVLDELDIGFCFFHCSSETKAKIVEEFESSFWNAGNMRQESNVTFQQFCEERGSRRKLQVDCDYKVASYNYWDMLKYLSDGENLDKWGEEESQRSSEMPEDISENAFLYVEEELEVHQDLQLAKPTDTFTGDMEEDNDDGVIDILDELMSPVEHDNSFDTGDIYGSNRDLDMAEDWGDDPFNLGSNCVGSPVMSFGEFMNIDEWNDGRPVMDDVGK